MAKVISVHILKETYERLQNEILNTGQSVSGFICQSLMDYLSSETPELSTAFSEVSMIGKGNYDRVQFRPNQFLDKDLRSFADANNLQISVIVREAIEYGLRP